MTVITNQKNYNMYELSELVSMLRSLIDKRFPQISKIISVTYFQNLKDELSVILIYNISAGHTLGQLSVTLFLFEFCCEKVHMEAIFCKQISGSRSVIRNFKIVFRKMSQLKL